MTYDNVDRIDSVIEERERDERDESKQAAIDSCYLDFLAACRSGNTRNLSEGIESVVGGTDRLYSLICDLAFSAEPAANLAERARKLIDEAACKFAEFNGGD